MVAKFLALLRGQGEPASGRGSGQQGTDFTGLLLQTHGRELDAIQVVAQGEWHAGRSGLVYLGNPGGKYGMPGSGLPRCAGKQASGLPGSLDIRLWANRELGESSIYDLPNELSGKSFVFLTSMDNVGAWILLDYTSGNLDDTCYYSRGEASDVRENVKFK